MDEAPDPFEPESVRRARATAAHRRHMSALAAETIRETEDAIRRSQEAIDAAASPRAPLPPPDDPTR